LRGSLAINQTNDRESRRIGTVTQTDRNPT
jgi:hypothetical protein